jgi:hypothetical protein
MVPKDCISKDYRDLERLIHKVEREFEVQLRPELEVKSIFL